MKIVISKAARRIILAAVVLCLLIAVTINLIGYAFDCKYVSVIAAVSEADKYEVRSQLLTEAMDKVGVCSPEEAAKVWAEGLEMRSAAMQYSVMDKALKDKYAKQLEKNFPNWVTGVSSPWIQNFETVRKEDMGNESSIILSFDTETSTGPAGKYKAVLTIKHEGDFWRITDINADPGLYPYTGLSKT